MYARKIILLTFIIGFGLLLCNSVFALPRYQLNREHAIESHDGALLEQHPVSEYGYSRKKPEFPPPEERQKITERRRVLERYPQISVTGGLLIRSQRNALLNDTFGRLESGYGFRSSDGFPDGCVSAALGMRLFLTRDISLLSEYNTGGNGVISVFTVSGLYSFYRKKDIAMSIGFGRAIQRLQAERDYSYHIDHRTLEKIRIDTGEQDGWIFSAVLDAWGQVIGQTTGFFLALNYIDAPTVSGPAQLRAWTETVENPNIEISMSSWSISGGLSFTFQI